MLEVPNPEASVSTERLLSATPRTIFAAFERPARVAMVGTKRFHEHVPARPPGVGR